MGRLWYQPDEPNGAAGGVTVRAERFVAFNASRVLLDASWTSSYSRAFLQVQLPWSTPRYGVRSLFRAGVGSDLPLQLTFALGGSAGFPGIEPSELRGSNELSGQAEFWYRVIGPLEAQLDVGGGSISEEGDFSPAIRGSGEYEWGWVRRPRWVRSRWDTAGQRGVVTR